MYKVCTMTLNPATQPQVKVGGTPVTVIPFKNRNKVYAKLEFANAYGSIKDRPALWMLKKAIERGDALPGVTTLIEPTSGNTGIALAGLASQFGLKLMVVIPEKASEETKSRIRELGAEVVETTDDLCPRVGQGTDQAISLARAYVNSFPGKYYMLDQYSNEANYLSHYESTGPEIWRQTAGEITHFVAGVGTGGTLTGAGAYLKSMNPSIRVVGVQPQRNHHVQGLRNLEESAMPELLAKRQNIVDQWITVTDEEAFLAVEQLGSERGLAVGPSSGAVFAAISKLHLEDAKVAVIFGDDAAKYRGFYLSKGIMTQRVYEQALENTMRMIH